MSRRSARVDPQFFAELDTQLGETRGPNGEPSASDFILIDLPTLSDRISETFDAYLAGDGAVVLIGVDIDHAAWPG